MPGLLSRILLLKLGLQIFQQFYFLNFKKVYIKDSNKLVQYYFFSITVLQFFPLWNSWVIGTLPWGEGGDARTSKTPRKKSVHSSYLFIGIFLVRYVLRKVSSLYVSKFNISAVDTELMNNNNNPTNKWGKLYKNEDDLQVLLMYCFLFILKLILRGRAGIQNGFLSLQDFL